MNSEQTIKLTNEFAAKYDKHVTKGLWKGPEVLFNELKKFIKPNDKLLDIGIGTGLASVPFKNAGIEIYGIDGSAEMIKMCKEKNLAKRLIQSDITQSDFELPNIQFDFIISNAVFHMIGDFFHIIKKAAQHLKTNGHLCFTVIPFNKKDKTLYNKSTRQGIYYNHKKEIDLYVFHHTISYIYYVLKENKLQLISNQVFLAFKDFHEKQDVFFEYYHAIKR